MQHDSRVAVLSIDSIETKEYNWVRLIESVTCTKIKIEVHESLKLKSTADYFARLKIVKFRIIIFGTFAIKVLHLSFVSISAKVPKFILESCPTSICRFCAVAVFES